MGRSLSNQIGLKRNGGGRVAITGGGFTLVELLIVLAVLAIVATVAVPNFQLVVESNRVNSTTNELRSSINYARSEAIGRSEQVSLAAADGSFEEGWCVYEGGPGGGCDGDDVIRQFEPSGSLSISTDDNVITFDRRGRPTPGGFDVDLAPLDCTDGADRAKRVRVNAAGQARVQPEDC